MVFCCFDETYEEEAVSTIVVDQTPPAKNLQTAKTDNTDNRKKVSVIVPDGVYAGQALMVRSPDGKQVTQAVVPKGCGPGKSFCVTFPTYSPEVITLDQHVEPGCVHDIDRFLTPNPSIPEVLATRLSSEDDDDDARPASVTRNSDNNSIRESPENTPNTVDPREVRQDLERHQEPPASSTPAGLFNKVILLDDEEDEDDEDVGLAQSPSMGAATAPPRLSADWMPGSSLKRNKKALSKHTERQAPPSIIEAPRAEEKEDEESEPEQKVLLVRVPPGVPPGSTLHVEIPGENRTVVATVPEGVSSFHVCYTPRPSPLLAPPQRRQMQPRPEHKLQVQQPQVQHQSRAAPATHYRPVPVLPPAPEGNPVPTTTAAVPTGMTPTGQQKLLLVRVPPGTTAGTTIHVSVPDEPGRILAAVVPAGNVSEFHVSYESRVIPVDPPRRSFIAPVSPYRNHSMGDTGLTAGAGYPAYAQLHYHGSEYDESRYENDMASF